MAVDDKFLAYAHGPDGDTPVFVTGSHVRRDWRRRSVKRCRQLADEYAAVEHTAGLV